MSGQYTSLLSRLKSSTVIYPNLRRILEFFILEEMASPFVVEISVPLLALFRHNTLDSVKVGFVKLKRVKVILDS